MRSRGSSRETLRRLCSRAPRITSLSATAVRDYPCRPGRPGVGMDPVAVPRSAHRTQLTLQLLHLVAQAGGVLEAQVGGGLVHLLLEGEDEPLEVVRGHLDVDD